MSARSSTVGPAPLRITPTTPVPPTFAVTSAPAFLSSAAIRLAVAVSRNDSSGFWWKCTNKGAR